MKNAISALLILVVASLSQCPCFGATMQVIANPYSDYGRFLEQYAESHKFALPDALKKKITHTATDLNLVTALNIVDLPYDEFQGCEQLGYELSWDKAIEIKGVIEPSDGEAFKKVLDESKSLDDDGCGVNVLIDSPGGDLRAALEIGRQVNAENRFVIVPEGGQCLSACIFILLAAKFEDTARHISKAIAFSDSTIAVHWPDLAKEDNERLQRVVCMKSAASYRMQLDSLGHRSCSRISL
jgi:hypothetical protein